MNNVEVTLNTGMKQTFLKEEILHVYSEMNYGAITEPAKILLQNGRIVAVKETKDYIINKLNEGLLLG